MARRMNLADPATLRRLKLLVLLIALVIAVILPLYYGEYRTFQFTRVLVYAIAVLGLGLLTGFNGQISLGHGAFFAVGAYTSAVLIDRFDVPYLATLIPAALLTFALGFALGIPALRLHGPYLALVTLGVAVVTPPVLKRFSGLTGGAMGLSLTKPQAPAWTGLEDDQWLYYIVLVATLLAFAVAWDLVHSRIGRAMIAIRDDPLAAETMGVELARVKTRTFAWSAMYAGVAGALFTWVIGFVSPDSFGVAVSIQFLAGLVVGGLGTISGPLFGAAFLVFVPNVSQDINDAAPGIAFGALLILAMYVAPGGIVGLARQLWGRLVAVSTPRGPPTPARGDTSHAARKGPQPRTSRTGA
jgi:branched-chain amino acid transport system permease protein